MLRQARDQALFARRQLQSCPDRRAFSWSAPASPPGRSSRRVSPHREIVLVITLVWAVSAMLTWLWQPWRDRRLVAEIAGYDQLQAGLNDG